MLLKRTKVKPGYYARTQLMHKFWPASFSHASRFKFASSLISKYRPKTVIDYGCGDATFLSLIYDNIELGTGIEVKEEDVADLKKRFKDIPNINFLSTKQFQETQNGLTADLVLCMEVLEHCSDIPAVLENLKKHTSEQGCIVVSVPNETGFMVIVKTILRGVGALLNVGDYRYHAKYKLKELFTMVFASRETEIPRPKLGELYLHKGFNWKHFKSKYLDDDFSILRIAGTPFSFFGRFLSSQLWFTLKVK